jgi:hypothetical protein
LVSVSDWRVLGASLYIGHTSEDPHLKILTKSTDEACFAHFPQKFSENFSY